MTEKPLNVQVAEALGHKVRRLGPCTSCVQMPTDGGELPSAVEKPHYHWEMWREFEWEAPDGIWVTVPNFPKDWSATGPLIEKHEINIDLRGAGWCATSFYNQEILAGHKADPQFGPTPLIAVCHLILKLAEEGKLHADPDPVRP